MSSQRRLEKINELVRRFVAELLRQELDTDSLVTVSKVETSPNGQHSVIGITVFPFNKAEEVIKKIEKDVYEIQQKLNRGLKMRPVPKIRFELDESEEKGAKVLRAIDKI